MEKKIDTNEEEVFDLPEVKKGETFLKWLKKTGNAIRAIFLSFFGAITSFILIFIILAFGVYFSYAQGFKTAKPRINTTQTIFYDKNGEVMYESYGAKSPEKVPLSEIPDVLKNATLASEDSGFYSHGPVDIKGLTRAALINIKESEKLGILKVTDLFSEKNYSQGGSTITQQLIKNVYLTDERSFERKIKEIAYSFEMEKGVSKDQILEDYLNNVYYGEQALGIQNASKIYFDKDAKDLSLAEATMLAGITVAPSRYSPISGDFNEAKKRQEYVLSNMYHLGMVNFEEAKIAANEPLDFNEKTNNYINKYPYFTSYLKQELNAKLGEKTLEAGGIKVYTTLDPQKQQVAEEKAKEYVTKFAYQNVTNAAIVILDNKNKSIAALVGGVDWEKSKVNVATSPRQPGSSFKPIVYTAGLLEGYTASTILLDQSINFGGIPPYRPKNYDGKFHGNVTVRTALANSLNIPAVEMTSLAGIDKVAETARNMGITTIKEDPSSYGLSLGLGSAEVKLIELTRAYSVFPNQGKLASFVGVTRIVDNEGTEIYKQPVVENQAIDPAAAYVMTNILSDNNARKMVFGTNSPLNLKDRKVGAKTGTTDDYADSWTVGFTPQYTVGVWMGNNDSSKMKKVSGVEGAAYIWNAVMKDIHTGLPVEDFPIPEKVEQKWINPKTGELAAKQGAPGVLEYFIVGTAPTGKVDLSYLNVFKKTSVSQQIKR